MKIGISFNGISYGYGRNYEHCISNTNNMLIKPLQEIHQVKTYLCTYGHPLEMYQYKATKHIWQDKKIHGHQVLNYIAGLEQLRGEDLEFIFSTRFDIHFHQKITDIAFDYTKFNALFHELGWRGSNFTTDNLFAFPYSMLEQVIECLQDMYVNPARAGQMDLHHLWYRMSKTVSCHVVSEIDELSNYNSFYSLCNEKWGKCQ